MADMRPVRTAVILAAGLGTRMLPATKAVPKELLPVFDTPLIQLTVEEAAASGIERVVFVIAEGKEAIREHFAPNGRVVRWLRERGQHALADVVERPAHLAEYVFAWQDAPLGIAHAVRCAREHIAGEPFLLMFPDDLILSQRPCAAQLIEAYERTGGTVIAVHEVPTADIPQYGIVAPDGEGNPVRLRGVVEKPPADRAPSNLGIVGRYVLSETILEHIERIKPGAGGELQITDAIASQIAAGEPVYALRYEGERFDTGRPAGWLAASVAVALRRPDARPLVAAHLARLIGEQVHAP